MFFRRLNDIWNKHGFTITVVATIIFFLLYWLFITRHRKEGTWSTSYYYPIETPSSSSRPNSYYNHLSQLKPSKKRVTSFSKGEMICKQYVEHVFERPFQKCRPSFLYNTVTNDHLELDMYNPEINLAIEYNGKQHYEYVPYLHNHSRINFHNQKYRDEKKKELCIKHNVPLIIVPYTIPHDKIPAFIQQEIRRYKIQGVKKW